MPLLHVGVTSPWSLAGPLGLSTGARPTFFSDHRRIVDSGIRRVNTQMRIAVLALGRLCIDSHGYRCSLGDANLAGWLVGRGD